MENTKPIYHIHVISNSHWDREWYMSHEKYLARLVPLMDRLLRIMEEQPRYIFVMDGQFAMLEDYLAIRPEREHEVSDLIKEGRLKVGPWYTQPLETLISGEAMIRNLQLGIARTEKLGPAMRVSYEIDEFGHASQTPQILCGFDIHSAIAWRGLPKGSRSAVKWISPDGSSVILCYSNDGYGEATALPLCGDDFNEIIDGDSIPRAGLVNRIAALRRHREGNADTSHLLWLNGIDHSFAQPDILAVLQKAQTLSPELHIRQDTPEGFVDALARDYAEHSLPWTEVKGELMYTRESVLESTHACHPMQKKANYDTENYLEHALEPLCTLAWLHGETYPDWAIKRAWKYVLENHAHDSLGCTSVDEVYEEVMNRYRCAYSLAEQTLQESLRGLMHHGKEGNAVYLFNRTSSTLSGTVPFAFDIPRGMGDANFHLTDAKGNMVPMEILEVDSLTDVRYNPRMGHPTRTPAKHVRGLVQIDQLPAYGFMRLNLEKGTTSPRTCRNLEPFYYSCAPAVMENDYLRVAINQNGTFDLTDKVSGRTYPQQLLFEDSGDAADCYVHQQPYNDRRIYFSTATAASVRQLYDTPLGCAYQIEQTLCIPDGLKDNRTRRGDLPGSIDICTELFLGADARDVKITITVNNHARNHRLRVLFPTHLAGATVSRSGQPFDTVERPIARALDPELYEQPYATCPMQDFCDVTDGDYGLTVAAAGIYEYECTDNASRTLALTLLRSTDFIDLGGFASPRYLMSKALMLDSPITYQMALIPHGADMEPVYGRIAAALQPPIVMLNRQSEISVMTDFVSPACDLPECGNAVNLEQFDHVEVTTIKKGYRRDTLIVRLHNRGDKEVTGKLRLTAPLVKPTVAYHVNLNEDRLSELSLSRGGAVTVTIPAAGIYTVEFEVSKI
ncbi:MAG: hypothetical protein IJW40_08910 [Clostridia bacterium]|nr:hypothetical protein [Clostridia bacterium]